MRVVIAVLSVVVFAALAWGEAPQFPERVPVRPELEAKGIEGVGLTAERVNEAIERGRDFLWKHLQEEYLADRRTGDDSVHLPAMLALVHLNAHEEYPEFDRIVREYLSGVEMRAWPYGTYAAGVLAMIIESYGDDSFLPLMRDVVQYLVECQGEAGSWNYNAPVPKEVYDGQGPRVRRVLQVSGGRRDAADEEPVARRTGWEIGIDGDNSVSQMVLLGLYSAHHMGVKIDPEVWRRSLMSYRSRQNEGGGWGYQGHGSYGSMTCAGICAIAISQHILGEKEAVNEEAIERGLAWLNQRFTVAGHPEGPMSWHYYYLYSLERVGRILDTEFVGEHEWYAAGARFLIDAQQADGGWIGIWHEQKPILPTSFALLFLTRATPKLEKDVPEPASGPGTLRTVAVAPPAPRLYIILDASGSMLEEMEGRAKFEIAREAVGSLLAGLPDETEVALRVYGHRLRAIEEGASEDTELLIPMQRLNRGAFAATLEGLRSRGRTPIALSLREAAGELSRLPRGGREGQVTLVLLTDGGEDTRPRQDPVAAAEAIGQLEGVRFHIVGFDIHRQDWSEQLAAMARAGRAIYHPARASRELELGLQSAVLGVPDSFVLHDADGAELQRGEFGEAITLPEGEYRLRTVFAGREFDEPLWINPGGTTTVTFDAAAMVAGDEGPPPRPSPGVPGEGEEGAGVPGEGEEGAAGRFCTQCGQRLVEGGRFCGGCGAVAP